MTGLRIHVLALILAALAASTLFAQGQIDVMTPAETGGEIKAGALSLRVRLVKADAPPPAIDVFFRRGLYWKRVGPLGKVKPGEWTPPKDCAEFFKGEGSSDFVVVEFTVGQSGPPRDGGSPDRAQTSTACNPAGRGHSPDGCPPSA